jgi:signal transduction histidine kinase
MDACGRPLLEVFRIVEKASGKDAENPFDRVLRYGAATGLKKGTILISRDGEERFISASSAPIKLQDGSVIGVVVVFRDITRIKQTEERLASEQRVLSVVFDSSPVGMLVLGEVGAVKRINASLSGIIGKEPWEIVGKRIGEALGCPYCKGETVSCGNDRKCRACHIHRALDQGFRLGKAVHGLESRYEAVKDGRKEGYWFRINSEPVMIDGSRHIIMVIDDITRKREMEKTLEDSNRMLKDALDELKITQSQLIQGEKLAGIGQLAAGIAHEINNPLAFIMSNMDTARRYMGKYNEVVNAYRDLRSSLYEAGCEGETEIREALKKIDTLEKKNRMDFIKEDLEGMYGDARDGLERIRSIVTGLRMFSHADHQEDFGPYDLNAGIKNTLLVAHNAIKYSAAVEENLGSIPEITANGGQINQVLLNMIINAVHAIEGMGARDTGIIKISTHSDMDYVYCIIEDNGTGIKKENINKIFDPFFTTKPVGKGTGLGLSISYEIVVNRHKGKLSVESVPGSGTRFTIKLPIKRPGTVHS